MMRYFLTICNWQEVICQSFNWSNLDLIMHYEIAKLL